MAKALHLPTQNQRIYGYLLTHGSITQSEANEKFGCSRLGARIWDIKHTMGVPIKKVMERGTNRFGERTSYARYFLVRDQENAG